MSPRPLTISALARAEACSASHVLHAIDEDADEYGEHGVAIHAYLEAIAEGKRPHEAIAKLSDEHREAALAIDLNALPHVQAGKWAAEVPVAVTLGAESFGRLLPKRGRRDYTEALENEVPGTADLVGYTDDAVIVLDVKTGRRRRGRPGVDLQLGALAVALAAASGRSRAVVGWIYQSRTAKGEAAPAPEFSTDELDGWQLVEMHHRIEQVFASVSFWRAAASPESPPPMNVGPQCHYCPARRACPAHVIMTRAFLANDLDVALRAAAQQAFDGAPGAYVVQKQDIPVAIERAKAVRDMAERALENLTVMAQRAGPIDLGRNQVLAMVQAQREKLIPEKAAPVLDELFGPGSAERAIEREPTLTKVALELLIQQRVAVTGETVAACREMVLNRLRGAGAAKVSSWTQLKEVDKSKV